MWTLKKNAAQEWRRKSLKVIVEPIGIDHAEGSGLWS
jgi:hypothetical protein